MFDADRPIRFASQDKLGRDTFAKYLARCMLDHTALDSLVISLQGGWGTGKTSIINMMIEELQNASNNMLDQEKPVILNFNPWSYSGQGQLIYGFYRRLSSQCKQAPFLENAAQITYLLELYVSFFTNNKVPRALRHRRDVFSALKKPVVNHNAWESGRDPIQVKNELNALLSKLKHKIIIIIDNISRLRPEEINQVLQIVKSMGDYPNTIYLLAFDKQQVVEAINHIHFNAGKEYIDKLVQLPFDVPPISSQDLENLLFARLENLVEMAPEDSWNKAYWYDIYYSSLKYFFRSSRDITRYVNTLNFTYPRVKELVNPVDFVALTAIEIFAPEVFYAIRENKDLFTDMFESVYVLDNEKLAKDKLRCDELLQRTQAVAPAVLLELLIQIFPRLRSLYRPDEFYFHSESIARNHRRACSPDLFDLYFRVSIPSGDIPAGEFSAILNEAKNQEMFSQALLRLNQDGRALKFLQLLDSNVERELSKKYYKNVVNALIDSGDLLPEVKSTALSFDTLTKIHRICQQLLRTFKTSEERFSILKYAFTKANKSLYSIIHEVTLLGEEFIEGKDTFVPNELRNLTIDQVVKLREVAVERIEFWAKIGRLGEHPKLVPILMAWQAWGNPTDCQLFVYQLIRDPRGLISLLTAFLQEPIQQTMTKLSKSPGWINYLEALKKFIVLRDLQEATVEIFESDEFEKLREKEQLAILIFLDLVNAQTVKIIPKTSV